MTPQVRESEVKTTAVARIFRPAPVADVFKAPIPAPLPDADNDNEAGGLSRRNILSARRRRWNRIGSR